MIFAVSTMNRKTNQKVRGRKTLRQKTSEQINDGVGPIVKLTKFNIVPPRALIRLRYNTPKNMTSASAATSTFYNANGAFDLDPSVGNPTMCGFNEWMALYGVYRVIRFSIKGTAMNNEAFPVRIATGFFPQTQTTFTVSQWGNAHCVEHPCLGAITGVGRTVFRRSIDINRLLGVHAASGDLTQYYGTSASNPGSIASFAIGISSMNGSVLTNGVSLAIEIQLELELSYPIKLTQV
jgi:hypothetical protein